MQTKGDASPMMDERSIGIERVAFGVRYEPQYKIRDNMGAVIDEILGGRDSPFGPEFFPLSESGPHVHRLLNPRTGDSLTITQSDTVMTVHVPTSDVVGVRRLAESFSRHVVTSVREQARLGQVLRYGVLLQLAECSQELDRSPVSVFLQPADVEAKDLHVRFSRRLAAEEALFRKDVSDYVNVISTVRQDEDGQVWFTLDYQVYFDPPLDRSDWASGNYQFDKFANRGVVHFEKRFVPWMEVFARAARAA